MPFFDHRGIKIFYEISGKGPPLILINGLSADVRQWEPLVGNLEDSFEILRYDMRCAGKSDKPQAPFSIQDLSEEVLALLKHVNINKINMLGFSMGGMIVQDFTLKYPKMVDKLILLATAPSIKRPYPPSSYAKSLLYVTEFSEEILVKLFFSIFGPKYRKKVLPEDYVRMKLEDENAQPLEAYLNQLQALDQFDCVEEVDKISRPTLIATGDHDKLVSPENSQWLNQKIQGSKLHYFKGVGHMVPLECPQELSNLLKSFL